MRATSILRMRPSVVLHATFPIPQAVPAGPLLIRSDFRKASAWTTEFITDIGCRLIPTDSPIKITKYFSSVDVPTLDKSVQSLLKNESEDGVVKSIKKWLAVLEKQRREAAVDSYVSDVLHGCDLDDGVATLLMRQETLRFSFGKQLKVVCRADHLLRCGTEADNFVGLVTQESKKSSDKGHAWAQIVAEMMAAALTNYEALPSKVPPPIFGIRVVGQCWTFLRAEFSSEHLRRLRRFELSKDGRFELPAGEQCVVHVWGGEFAPVGGKYQTRSLKWGLDISKEDERQQLMLMVVALGLETRAITEGFTKTTPATS